MKVVCFDLDDTICDLWEGEHKARDTLIERLVEDSGHPRALVSNIYDAEWATFKGNYMDLVAEGLDEIDIRDKHMRGVLKELGVKGDTREYAGLHCTEKMDGIYLYPDARNVMDTLKKKYRLTMITNGASVWQREKIEKLDIEDYFEEIIVSGELGHHKPSSKIFEEMTRRTQVDASEIIYIGNNYMKDVVGAKESGWKAVWVKRNDEERDESVPDYVINELSELLEIL